MGAVVALRPEPGIAPGPAVAAYLDHLQIAGLSPLTITQYKSTLDRMSAAFSLYGDVADITPEALTAWMQEAFRSVKPATWNRARVVLCSAWTFWALEGWAEAGVPRSLPKRRVPRGRDRAMDRADIAALLASEDIPLRERALWSCLYETGARAAEIIRLNAEDLDVANHCTRVLRKRSHDDLAVWQDGTAALLARLLGGRDRGPVFTTGHGRLSYRQAADIFKAATAGVRGAPYTLHSLRHSGATHDSEDGMPVPMLCKKYGWEHVRSAERYARPSDEALIRWQAEHDPARRR